MPISTMGLVMLHQPGADDAAVVRQSHQYVDGLARIAAGVDHVGGQVDASQGALAGIGARGHRFALGRADAIGAGEEVGDGNRLQEVGQPLRLDGVRAQRTAQQENGNEDPDERGDARCVPRCVL
ncbi:hypothetical protein WJ972_14930 [Achromobacter insuavis]